MFFVVRSNDSFNFQLGFGINKVYCYCYRYKPRFPAPHSKPRFLAPPSLQASLSGSTLTLSLAFRHHPHSKPRLPAPPSFQASLSGTTLTLSLAFRHPSSKIGSRMWQTVAWSLGGVQKKQDGKHFSLSRVARRAVSQLVDCNHSAPEANKAR